MYIAQTNWGQLLRNKNAREIHKLNSYFSLVLANVNHSDSWTRGIWTFIQFNRQYFWSWTTDNDSVSISGQYIGGQTLHTGSRSNGDNQWLRYMWFKTKLIKKVVRNISETKWKQDSLWHNESGGRRHAKVKRVCYCCSYLNHEEMKNQDSIK